MARIKPLLPPLCVSSDDCLQVKLVKRINTLPLVLYVRGRNPNISQQFESKQWRVQLTLPFKRFLHQTGLTKPNISFTKTESNKQPPLCQKASPIIERIT